MSEPTAPTEDNVKYQLAEQLYVSILGLNEEALKARGDAIKAAIAGTPSVAISESTKKILGTIVEAENIDALPPEFKAAVEEVVTATTATKLAEERKLLEAANKARLEEEIKKQNDKLNEESRKVIAYLVENINGYLKEVTVKWLDENKVSVSAGVRQNVLENFYRNVVRTIKESGINADLTPELKTKITSLKTIAENYKGKYETTVAQLNEARAASLEQNKKMTVLAKAGIFESATHGLSDMQKEKVKKLAEGMTFKGMSDFGDKIKQLSESVTKASDIKPTQLVSESVAASITAPSAPVAAPAPAAKPVSPLAHMSSDYLFGTR